MALQVRGLYKIHGVGIFSNDVRVSDGSVSFNVSEEIYSGQCIEPAFDILPWKEEFEAANRIDA
jgi:hypothetical protein